MIDFANKIDWIGVDWGTSNVRVWGIGADQNLVFFTNSKQGMSVLRPDQFETALLTLIEPYLPTSRITKIICCGMVGAKTGWSEAPYVSAPCSPQNADRAVLAPSKDSRIDVYILPGVSQDAPSDVMRGEETQLVGILQDVPNFSGTVCLPGTHSKWVQLSEGKIQTFRTFMTGEMYSLLLNHSLLRQPEPRKGWDKASFVQGLRDAKHNPPMFLADLFSVRAKTLLENFSPEQARARISGLLIGQELSAIKQFCSTQKMILGSEGKLGEIYSAALSELGIDYTLHNSQTLVLAGLKNAHENIIN